VAGLIILVAGINAIRAPSPEKNGVPTQAPITGLLSFEWLGADPFPDRDLVCVSRGARLSIWLRWLTFASSVGIEKG
jgi:hypothetical protein